MMRLVPVLLLACLLAACASQSNSRRAADLASCRRNADQTMGPVSSIDPSDEHNPSPMAMARREELRGQYDSLVQDCMTELPPFVDAPSKEDAPH
jgi:outer membrane PBP1 activator LpoA protein